MPSKDDGLERGGHKPELQCPVCFDVLGHSGCLECLASVQQLNAQCPLCRAPFKDAVLSVNRVLREVVEYDAFTNGHSVDEDGWETMPSSKATYRQFAKDQQQTHPRDRADAMQLALRQPSAPPLRITLDQMMEGGGAIMEAEPPRWLPDSCAPHCGICNQPFRALWRTRHHCRLCGGIFCHQCCHKRMLLPPRFHTRAPERVCQMCSSMLEPLQPFLASAQSRASMAPIHDVTDWSSIRSWVNLPVTVSLEDDIYKATNILRSFCKASLLDKEKSIPQNLLSSAAGFAVLSVLRLGAGWSWTAGTGAVVARREEGGWTPPSAIGCFGFGWGLQAGGELIDLLLVLPTYEAVQAFCSSGHVGVGGHVSLAAGPFGRQAEAALRMGSCGRMVCYNYSMSKGVFLGMALEGSLMYARTSLNHDFYGQPLSSQALLLENSLPPPAAARTLYEALDALVKQYHTLPASRLHSVGGLLTAGSGASSREDAAPPAQHGAGAIAAGESGTGRQARRRSSNKTIV